MRSCDLGAGSDVPTNRRTGGHYWPERPSPDAGMRGIASLCYPHNGRDVVRNAIGSKQLPFWHRHADVFDAIKAVFVSAGSNGIERTKEGHGIPAENARLRVQIRYFLPSRRRDFHTCSGPKGARGGPTETASSWQNPHLSTNCVQGLLHRSLGVTGLVSCTTRHSPPALRLASEARECRRNGARNRKETNGDPSDPTLRVARVEVRTLGRNRQVFIRYP